MLMALLVAPTPAQARPDPSPQQVRSRIEAILAQPDFSSQRTEKRVEYTGEGWGWDWDWPWKGKDDEEDEADEEKQLARDEATEQFSEMFESFVAFTARFAEAVLWALLILLLVIAFRYRDRWLHLRTGSWRWRKPGAKAPAVIVGIDIRPESLPPDIPARAWALWQAGDPRGCLSLLYRGALATMVHDRGIELPASATEADCVQRVRQQVPEGQAAFFDRLTRAWQIIAYARRPPEPEQARSLCDDWRDLLSRPHEGAST